MKNKVTLNLTVSEDHKQDARDISKSLFGKPNISTLFGFLIEKYKREN